MSQQNVEVVRRSFGAFARGDFDAAFDDHDPGAEWRTASDEPDSQTYRGVAGMRDLVASLAELWVDRFDGSMEFEDFIDRGDWVVVPWNARLRGRASGIEVLVNETYAVLLAQGKIVRVEEYRSTEQALDAVRLGR